MRKTSGGSYLRRGGLTLLEVLAGLSILGGVLSSMVLVRSRLLDQELRAGRKIEATEALGTLLSSWHKTRGQIPQNAEGDAGDGTRFRFRTRVQDVPELSPLDLRVLRVEIYRREARERTEPEASVEIVLPGRLGQVAAPTGERDG